MPVTYAMLSPQLRFIHSLMMFVKSADMTVKEEQESISVWGQDENTREAKTSQAARAMIGR